jgi:hypothetical protein
MGDRRAVAMIFDPLGDAHYLVFGRIVQQFARFERLVEIVINAALGGRMFGLTALTISGLAYNAKCEALESLLRLVTFADNQNSEILGHITSFNAYSPLRNFIAHRSWIPGTREGSIKPLSVSARGGKAKVVGVHDEERDYTLDELFEIAGDLARIHDAFQAFLLRVGAIPDMAEKIDTMRSGRPSSQV